jgi:branched-chain amino acid transport system substrate-binding protein
MGPLIFGRDLANVFEQATENLPVSVVDRRAYDAVGSQHLMILEAWRDLLDFDAVFLAGSLPDSAMILRLMRDIGITAPVFGGVGLDSPELIGLGAESVEGVVVPSVFHPDIPAPHIKDFVARFEAVHGVRPDPSVAGGYDAVRLLAQAIEAAGSARPAAIANALRETRDWQGLTGVFNGSPTGELREAGMVLTEVRDGAFQYVRRSDD